MANARQDLGDLIQHIPLTLIRINRFQGDDLIDKEHVQKLAEEIRASGMLLKEPVGRPVAEDPRLIELADGNHRFLAYKLLNERHPNEGWHMMPVKIVARMGDHEFFRVMWMGNTQRQMSPLERGRWLVNMQEAGGLRQTELVSLSGISQQMVSRYVAVARAPDWLQRAVHAGLVPYQFVSDLRPMPAEQYGEMLERLAAVPQRQRKSIIENMIALSNSRKDETVKRIRTQSALCPGCRQIPERLTYVAVADHFECSRCGASVLVSLRVNRKLGRPRKRGVGEEQQTGEGGATTTIELEAA